MTTRQLTKDHELRLRNIEGKLEEHDKTLQETAEADKQKTRRLSRGQLLTVATTLLAVPSAVWAGYSLFRDIHPTANIAIASRTYDTFDEVEQGIFIPGGIKFTFTNNGNRSVLLTNIRAEIEDYVSLSMWYPADGPALPSSCYGLELPTHYPPTGMVVDKQFEYSIQADEVTALSVAINLKGDVDDVLFDKNGPISHIYRLHIAFAQNDGTMHDAGHFIIFAPWNDIELFWLPAQSNHTAGALTTGTEETGWKSREQHVKETLEGRFLDGDESINQEITKSLTKIKNNEEALKRIFAQDKACHMSPKMEAIRDSLTSGEYDATLVDTSKPDDVTCSTTT